MKEISTRTPTSVSETPPPPPIGSPSKRRSSKFTLKLSPRRKTEEVSQSTSPRTSPLKSLVPSSPERYKRRNSYKKFQKLKSTSKDLQGSSENKAYHQTKHLVVLQHGLHGDERDWLYFVNVLQTAYYFDTNTNKNEIVFYTARSNSTSYVTTHDGIDMGGTRLADEIQSLDMPNLEKFSIIGHSLGGLYIRYAIGVLKSRGFFKSVVPVNFITLASPHLGIRRPARGPFNKLFNTVAPLLFNRTGSQLTLTDTDVGEDTLSLAGLCSSSLSSPPSSSSCSHAEEEKCVDIHSNNFIDGDAFINAGTFQTLDKELQLQVRVIFTSLQEKFGSVNSFSGTDCLAHVVVASSKPRDVAIELLSALLLSTRMFVVNEDSSMLGVSFTVEHSYKLCLDATWEDSHTVAAAKASIGYESQKKYTETLDTSLHNIRALRNVEINASTRTLKVSSEALIDITAERITIVQSADQVLSEIQFQNHNLTLYFTKKQESNAFLIHLLASGMSNQTLIKKPRKDTKIKTSVLLLCLTKGEFIKALGDFKYRSLYANIFYDFQVPYSSASIRSHNPYRGCPTGNPTSAVYRHIALASLANANTITFRNTQQVARDHLIAKEVKEEETQQLKLLWDAKAIFSAKVTTSDASRTSCGKRRNNKASVVKKSAASTTILENAGEGAVTVDSIPEAFNKSKKHLKTTLQAMLKSLQTAPGGYRRIDVNLDGVMAHERIIAKRAWVFSPEESGIDVCCHVADTFEF